MATFISFQPTDNFKAQIYTGTGASNAQTFPETTAMQPDITCIKNRDQSDFYVFANSLSGATKYVQTDDSYVQTTNAESVKSFDSDGFTVGTMNEVNTNTENFVSWNWKMGTTSGIAGSPSITPTAYTFNATAGQSIIQYTGTGVAATLPHGLGVAPKFIIVRNLAGGYNWLVYHETMGATKHMKLNTTAAEVTGATYWNDIAPTDTLFSVGTESGTNQSSDTLLAYCFAEKLGYSAFGSYVGNGNNNGPMIYTGFRPGFILIKGTGNVWDWEAFDNERKGWNGSGGNKCLQPSNVAAESTEDVDILANGFKIRDSGNRMSQNDYEYIYAAFAKSPFVASNDTPGVAR